MTKATDVSNTSSHLCASDYKMLAHKASTIRAYDTGLRLYEEWCQSQGIQSFPADPAKVGEYLADIARNHKTSTVRQRLSAIVYASAQRLQKLDIRNPAVADVVRGIARAKNAPQTQAAAFMLHDVTAMLGVCEDNLRGFRDRAILLVGFAAALRRSEIVGLNVEDVIWETQSVTLRLTHTKDEPFGRPVFVVLSAGQNPATCPVSALRTWLNNAQITSGPVFRKISTALRVGETPLHSDAIRRIVQARAMAAGLVGTLENPISPHGLRAGFITTAYEAGLSDIEIMEHVRHKRPESMRGYVRRPRLDNVNPVLKIGL